MSVGHDVQLYGEWGLFRSISVERGPRDQGSNGADLLRTATQLACGCGRGLVGFGAPRPWWQQDRRLPSRAGSGLGRKGGPRRLRCGRL